MQPILRASLRDQVYAQLRDGIRAGRFRPSDRLLEEEIAATLAVSRTPVREALGRLASEGLLVPRAAGGGYMLPVLTEADIAEIFEVRLLLEPHAAGRAARELSAASLAALEAAVAAERAAQRSGDTAAFIAANSEFRRILFGAVGRRLRQCIENFDDHVQYVRLLTLNDPATQALVVAGQERLMTALRAGDGEAAAEAMRAHDLAARRAIEALFRTASLEQPSEAAVRKTANGHSSRR